MSSAAGWRLKLRLPGGQSVITIDSSASLSTLLSRVAVEANADAVKLLAGFPPKDVLATVSDISLPLIATGVIRNGDTLTVQVDASPAKGHVLGTATSPAPPTGENSTPASSQSLSDTVASSAAEPPSASSSPAVAGRESRARASKTAAAGHIAAALEDDARLIAEHKRAVAAASAKKATASQSSATPAKGCGTLSSAPLSSSSKAAARARSAYFSRLGGAAAGRTLAGTSVGDAVAAAEEEEGESVGAGTTGSASLSALLLQQSGNARPRSASGVRSLSQSRAKRRRVSLGNGAASSGVGLTLEERLASAVSRGRGQGGSSSSGGGTDHSLDFLREASQLALSKQYEVTRAEGRVRAALAGDFQIAPVPTSRTLRGGFAQIRVRFRPSANARGRVEEEVVDNLPAVAVITNLRAVATAGRQAGSAAATSARSGAGSGVDEDADGDGEAGGDSAAAARELLKPALLARISPRQFWALVRYGGAVIALRESGAQSVVAPLEAGAGASSSSSAAASLSTGGAAPRLSGSALLRAAVTSGAFAADASVPWGSRRVDPEACLRVLAPEVDFSFLGARARRMTEKAMAAAAEAAADAADREARRRRRLGLPPLETGLTGSDSAVAGSASEAGEGAGEPVFIDFTSEPDGLTTAPTGVAGAVAAGANKALELGPSKLAIDHLHIARAIVGRGTAGGSSVTMDSFSRSLDETSGLLSQAGHNSAQGVQVQALQLAASLLGFSTTSSPDIARSGSAFTAPQPSLSDALLLGNSPAATSSELEALLGAAGVLDSYAVLSGVTTGSPLTTTTDPRIATLGRDDLEDGEPERRTFICEACGKAREVSSGEADLDAIEESEGWTCAGGGSGGGGTVVPSLLARGSCAAPDDDLVRLLGSEVAAAACDAAGLRSVLAVASARVPDDDDVLYCGPEGPVPAGYAVVNGLSELSATLKLAPAPDGSSAVRIMAQVTWSARLAQRMLAAPLLTAEPLTMEAASPKQPAAACEPASLASPSKSAASEPASSDPRALFGYAPSHLEYAHAGHKLAFAAALLLLAKASGPQASSESNSAVASSSSAVSSGSPALSAASLVASTRNAHASHAAALLRSPVGCVASLAIARAWQRFCRFDVLDEWTTSVLVHRASDAAQLQSAASSSGSSSADVESAVDETTGLPSLPEGLGEEDYSAREDAAAAVKAVLERMRLCGPLELACTPVDMLHRLLQDEGLARAPPQREDEAHVNSSAAGAASAAAVLLQDSQTAELSAAEGFTGTCAGIDISLGDVTRWRSLCERLLVAQPWLHDIAIA